MDGKGLLTWADGRRYEGQFKADKRNGRGKFVWSDGRTYDGLWLDGKQHGEGILSTADGSSKRRGTWQNGKNVGWHE